MGQHLNKAAIGIALASALALPVHAGTMNEQLKGFYELEVIGDFGGQSANHSYLQIPILKSNCRN